MLYVSLYLQNNHHFEDDIFKSVLLNKKCCTSTDSKAILFQLIFNYSMALCEIIVFPVY